jgi:hypothetical protein
MISPAGPQHLQKLRLILVKGAYERRDVWPDHKQAMEALKRRARTKKWDPRILDLFVVRLFGFRFALCRSENLWGQKYAIKPHPGSTCTETPYSGVTLACSRDQEAVRRRLAFDLSRGLKRFSQAMYRDAEGPIKPVRDLNKVCADRPVHLILGAVHDFMYV